MDILKESGLAALRKLNADQPWANRSYPACWIVLSGAFTSSSRALQLHPYLPVPVTGRLYLSHLVTGHAPSTTGDRTLQPWHRCFQPRAACSSVSPQHLQDRLGNFFQINFSPWACRQERGLRSVLGPQESREAEKTPILTCKKQSCSAAAEPQVFKNRSFPVVIPKSLQCVSCFAMPSVPSSRVQPLFEVANTARRSNAEHKCGFFTQNPLLPTSHRYPLGCSGAGKLVKENASPTFPPSHGNFTPPPLGMHHPASLEHKLGTAQGGTGEGEEELEMFASK